MPPQSQTWRPKPRRPSRLLARIDATPLLAIFLAFLWLFMFSGAVVMHPRGMVDLACATSATPRPAALREDSLHLSVSRDGSFFIPGNNYFPGSRVSRNDLPRVLRSMMQPEVEHRVYVSADARAKYSDVEGALTPSETPAFQTSHWWSSKDRARNTDNRA
jgi:biopolymer transport protein ExbD